MSNTNIPLIHRKMTGLLVLLVALASVALTGAVAQTASASSEVNCKQIRNGHYSAEVLNLEPLHVITHTSGPVKGTIDSDDRTNGDLIPDSFDPVTGWFEFENGFEILRTKHGDITLSTAGSSNFYTLDADFIATAVEGTGKWEGISGSFSVVGNSITGGTSNGEVCTPR